MGVTITEEELVQKEAIHDQEWQETIVKYMEGFPTSEQECAAVVQVLRMRGFQLQARIFALAMMQLHTSIARETGELLGPADCMEGEEYGK